MKYLLLILVMVISQGTVRAQQNPEEMLGRVRTAMEKLSLLEGHWTGTGSMTVGPGQTHEATVVESGEFRLDGTLFVIEGIGRMAEEVDGEHPVVHHAYGVISYDMMTDSYRMRAYRLGGQHVDATLTFDGNSIQWGFEDPRAGTIQYDIRVQPGSSWHETGKMSRDGGTTWYPFFEMTLEPSL